MIEIEHLTKRFADLVAVDGIDLTVSEGEFFAFIGPNGAGKTTTIKMLTGLLKPSEGTVKLCGYDVQKEYIAAKNVLSYIPDQPYLYDKLSGREFLRFVARMYQIEPQVAKKKIEELSETFDLADFIDELGETYSHGMKQRIVITAALLHNPDVIIIDEPLVGLDPHGANVFKEVFRDCTARGSTVFMSTHTLSLAEEVADRVGIINNGRIIALGSLDDIRRKARTDGKLEQAFLRLTEETTSSAP
ncbi:MAG: ABC transporter ATP-binding protein [Candidatus Brocadiia bacterium]